MTSFSGLTLTFEARHTSAGFSFVIGTARRNPSESDDQSTSTRDDLSSAGVCFLQGDRPIRLFDQRTSDLFSATCGTRGNDNDGQETLAHRTDIVAFQGMYGSVGVISYRQSNWLNVK